MAERADNGFAAYKTLVSGWGSPLTYDSSVATNIADDLQLIFAALRKSHYTISSQLLSKTSRKAALFTQFFFTWRIWSFCMSVCGRRMKMFVAVMCFFIVCVSLILRPAIRGQIRLILSVIDEYLWLDISYRPVCGECGSVHTYSHRMTDIPILDIRQPCPLLRLIGQSTYSRKK